MLEEYFTKREQLQAALLVTDIRHAPTKDDCSMYDFLQHYDLPILVIGTKLDKIPKNKRDAHFKRTRETLGMRKEDILLPFSSETGEGKEAAWSALEKYL